VNYEFATHTLQCGYITWPNTSAYIDYQIFMVSSPEESKSSNLLATQPGHEVPAHLVGDSTSYLNTQIEYQFYAKQAGGSTATTADASRLWQEICQFGKNQDFFSLNLLWRLRGAIDWLIGGPSFRRKRRHPEKLRIGDVICAWRVIVLQAECKLTLLLEMKLPGTGVLEFEIIPGKETNEIRVTAYFQPAGVWGRIYWYCSMPFHLVLFRAMTREIVQRAGQAIQ
jgi:hypothetical protein